MGPCGEGADKTVIETHRQIAEIITQIEKNHRMSTDDVMKRLLGRDASHRAMDSAPVHLNEAKLTWAHNDWKKTSMVQTLRFFDLIVLPGRIGQFKGFLKRIVRRLIRPIILPLIEQQNQYNADSLEMSGVIIQCIQELYEENQKLRNRIRTLEGNQEK